MRYDCQEPPRNTFDLLCVRRFNTYIRQKTDVVVLALSAEPVAGYFQ